MAKLGYKTPYDRTPRNIEWVYFACHPDDLQTCFESICNDIFQSQTCAIFYDTEPKNTWTPEQMEIELSQMQLFVVPVTSRLLYQPNAARDLEVPFAIRHHIPVLPMLQEGGADEGYERVFGTLQYLDKNSSKTDPTVLSYEQKLERSLRSVLLGDELTRRVRSCFSAYIFLSYRKKDRVYAQELMRIIHQNEDYRDIAIWYDEFLTPGEHFDQEIAQALRKSRLFVLAVTQNLLEEPNYVLGHEFPMAKRERKSILPIKMSPIDSDTFYQKYTGVPALIDVHDEQEMSRALKARLRVFGRADADREDPEHLFYIGLAYLNGIDMEVDRPRGVSLIQAAADAGLPDALAKLAQMYQTGEGVARDYEVAAKWWETYAARREELYRADPSRENGDRLYAALSVAGCAWRDLGHMQQARPFFEKAITVAQELLERFGGRHERELVARSYEQIGVFYVRSEWDHAAAKEYFEKALELLEPLYAERASKEEQLHLARVYGNLGDIYEELDLPGCQSWIQKAVAIYDRLAKAEDELPLSAWIELSHCCKTLGSSYKQKFDIKAAKEWYGKAEQIERRNYELTGDASVGRALATSCGWLGDLNMPIDMSLPGDLPSARRWYQEALELFESLCREEGTVQARRDLSLIYRRMGDLCREEGAPDEAEQWYHKALAINEQLVRETGTKEAQRDVAFVYDELGKLSEKRKKLPVARAWYQRALTIRKALCKEKNSVSDRSLIAENYNALGRVYSIEGDTYQASICLDRMLELCRQIAQETGSESAYFALAKACLRRSVAKIDMTQKPLDLSRIDREILEQACTILGELIRQFPDNRMYLFYYALSRKLKDGTLEAEKPAQHPTRPEYASIQKGVSKLLERADSCSAQEPFLEESLLYDNSRRHIHVTLQLYYSRNKRLFRKEEIKYKLYMAYSSLMTGRKVSGSLISCDTIDEIKAFLRQDRICEILDGGIQQMWDHSHGTGQPGTR